jgi:hypothetical protein
MAWTLAAPLVRQPHDQGLDWVFGVLLRDRLPAADQPVAGPGRTYDRWTVLIPFAEAGGRGRLTSADEVRSSLAATGHGGRLDRVIVVARPYPSLQGDPKTNHAGRLRWAISRPLDEQGRGPAGQFHSSAVSSAFGAGAGQDHSSGADIIEANEQRIFTPFPRHRHPTSGHPLRDLPADRGIPARPRHPQRGADRALPAGPSRSARPSGSVRSPAHSITHRYVTGGNCPEPEAPADTGCGRLSVRARALPLAGTGF